MKEVMAMSGRSKLSIVNEGLVRSVLAKSRVDERFKARAKLAVTEPRGTLLPEGNSDVVTDLIEHYSAPLVFTGGFYTGVRLHFARMSDEESWWKAMGGVYLQRYGDIFLLRPCEDTSAPVLKLSSDGETIKRLRSEGPRTVELRHSRTKGVRLA